MTRISRRSLLAGSGAALAAQAAEAPVHLTRPVRLGIIGLKGHVGELLGQLPRLPEVHLAAYCELDEPDVRRLSRNAFLAKAKRYPDYRSMLAQEKLDVVGVCNAANERAAGVLAALEKGAHFIAEKPIANTRSELDAIRKAVASTGLRGSTLLPMRFDPAYLALKKVVDSGQIGEVAQIGSQKSYKAGNRDPWMKNHATYGGTIPWIGVHMIDLMRWSSGRELVEVMSYQSQIGNFPGIGEMENTTASLFRLDNGGVATLRMDYFRPETAPTHGDDRLRLAGTKGIVEYQAATGVTLLVQGQKPEVLRELPAQGSVFVDFLQSVYENKPAALPLEDVFRTNLISLAAREAAEYHRLISI